MTERAYIGTCWTCDEELHTGDVGGIVYDAGYEALISRLADAAVSRPPPPAAPTPGGWTTVATPASDGVRRVELD